MTLVYLGNRQLLPPPHLTGMAIKTAKIAFIDSVDHQAHHAPDSFCFSAHYFFLTTK
jgi:hypothetical protein